jgi:hypothetical protein
MRRAVGVACAKQSPEPIIAASWTNNSSFDGTWSLNTSKSHLAGDTMSYEDAGNGMLKFTDSDQTYTFKPDGSSFTTPMGAEKTFLKTGDDSYTITSKKGAVLLRTTTIKLSSSTKVNLSSPNSLTIQTDGTDGVTFMLSAIKATCQAKWDGKDFSATGPTVSDGLTLAFSKAGPTRFKMVEKSKGKVIVIAHYELGPDGKTMTAKGTNGQGKEPFTEVWDKQS